MSVSTVRWAGRGDALAALVGVLRGGAGVRQGAVHVPRVLPAAQELGRHAYRAQARPGDADADK